MSALTSRGDIICAASPATLNRPSLSVKYGHQDLPPAQNPETTSFSAQGILGERRPLLARHSSSNVDTLSWRDWSFPYLSMSWLRRRYRIALQVHRIRWILLGCTLRRFRFQLSAWSRRRCKELRKASDRCSAMVSIDLQQPYLLLMGPSSGQQHIQAATMYAPSRGLLPVKGADIPWS